MNWRRARAIMRRHWMASWLSPPRLIDMLFWPVVDLTLWGMLTAYLQGHDIRLGVPIGYLLGGLVLWDLVFRAKNGISIAFLAEGYWHNVVNLLASPITPGEYLAGVIGFALTRTAVSWALITALAWILFAFGVFGLGPILALYIGLLLLFGVAASLVVVALILRFGPSVDEFAWAIAGLLAPFAAIFYPVSVLPGWAQVIARAMPPAHIFESMRSVLAGRPALGGDLVAALVLDVLTLVGAALFARAMFTTFRRRGFVTRYM